MPNVRPLIARAAGHCLLNLRFHPFEIETRARLHGRELNRGPGQLFDLLLDEHKPPEFERPPVLRDDHRGALRKSWMSILLMKPLPIMPRISHSASEFIVIWRRSVILWATRSAPSVCRVGQAIWDARAATFAQQRRVPQPSPGGEGGGPHLAGARQGDPADGAVARRETLRAFACGSDSNGSRQGGADQGPPFRGRGRGVAAGR